MLENVYFCSHLHASTTSLYCSTHFAHTSTRTTRQIYTHSIHALLYIVYVSAGEPFFKNGEKLRLYSIAVMGPGSVGKSAMTLQFVQVRMSCCIYI